MPGFNSIKIPYLCSSKMCSASMTPFMVGAVVVGGCRWFGVVVQWIASPDSTDAMGRSEISRLVETCDFRTTTNESTFPQHR